MNPVLQKMLGSAVRFGLGAAVGWLVAKGYVKEGAISPEQIEVLVATALTVVTGVAAYVHNKREVQIQQTALAVNKPGVTLEQVTVAVKAGVTAPATTPTNEAPIIVVPSTDEAQAAKRLVL